MGTLVLVRHATTGASLAGRNLGQRADPGLAEVGEKLASRTAVAVRAELAALAHDRIRVVTSPALRCRRTAAAIAAELGAEPEPEGVLQELDYGDWEGLTAQECHARDPALRARWERDPYRTATPGGESGRDVAGRAFPAIEALERWLVVERSRAVVVVSHNHVLRLRLIAALGLPLRDYRRRIVTAAGAYSAITFGGPQPVVRRLNVLPR